MVFTISFFSRHFQVKLLLLPPVAPAKAGRLKSTLKPLKQVYIPTKTTPISDSLSGLVTFSVPGDASWGWRNQLSTAILRMCVSPLRNEFLKWIFFASVYPAGHCQRLSTKPKLQIATNDVIKDPMTVVNGKKENVIMEINQNVINHVKT